MASFLEEIGMGAYQKPFRAKQIHGELLMSLLEVDMLTLKITSSSERYLSVRE